MRRPGAKRAAAVGALAGIVGINLVTCRQARGFTRFAPSTDRQSSTRALTLAGTLDLLARGVVVPRPVNRRTPRHVGLEYERHVFAGSRQVALEAWLVPRREARGTVVLFHGHAASKDSQLREARVFREMGFSALLVDFHGSGGSEGNTTSIGFHEAADVAGAFAHARGLPGAGPVVLYGASMGAAATLKAVADSRLQPAALIVESPFDSLLGTVRHRFTSRGLPSFPLAELLVFWGGVHEGFNGFRYRPVESAAQVDRPTLVLGGDSDPYVTRDESRAIFEALKGEKTLKLFAGVGHVSYLRARPEEWTLAVSTFLDRVIEARPTGP